MEILRIAFNFCMGLLAVIMVLMAVTMIAYILKVTLIELFGSELFKKLKEWYESVFRF